jgi:hypothetical protein
MRPPTRTASKANHNAKQGNAGVFVDGGDRCRISDLANLDRTSHLSRYSRHRGLPPRRHRRRSMPAAIQAKLGQRDQQIRTRSRRATGRSGRRPLSCPARHAFDQQRHPERHSCFGRIAAMRRVPNVSRDGTPMRSAGVARRIRERRQRHHVRNDERLRQWPRPPCAAYRLTWHLTANDLSPGRSCM